MVGVSIDKVQWFIRCPNWLHTQHGGSIGIGWLQSLTTTIIVPTTLAGAVCFKLLLLTNLSEPCPIVLILITAISISCSNTSLHPDLGRNLTSYRWRVQRSHFMSFTIILHSVNSKHHSYLTTSQQINKKILIELNPYEKHGYHPHFNQVFFT